MNKRILSLTLALVMILGTFTAVFAAELTVEEEAGRFLEKNGILKGDENGDLLLGENLERRDAVVLLSRLLKVEEEAAAHEFTEEMPSWTDVRTDNYYVPFFAWAQTNEYFEGNEDKTFAPRADITADEYALVLLRALGHKVNGHDSWKAALETAEKEGLLKDVTVESKKAVLRGEMAVMTLNALGQKMVDSEETLADFLGIELPKPAKPEKLTIENVYTENLAEVVVELSNADLATKEKLENPANYTISGTGNPKVYDARVEGDNVILTLVEAGFVEDLKANDGLVKGRKYKLTIRNIDTAINVTGKEFTAADNAIPVVESVEFIGTHGIKVVTSEPVKNPAERNFRVDGKRMSMIIEQYGRTLILTPYHDTSFDKDAKELTIESLEDYAGFKTVKEDHALELSKDDALPKVEKAYRDGKVLTLVFDRDVFHKSLKGYSNRRDLGNVSFRDGRIDVFALNDKDNKPVKVAPNVVQYVFDREIPRNAEVHVTGVENHFGKAMEAQDVVTELYVDQSVPVIISPVKMKSIAYKEENLSTDKKRADKVELVLTFDKELYSDFADKDGNISAKELDRYFRLYESDVRKTSEVTGEVKYTATVKKDKVTLTFNNIRVQDKDKSFDYILEVKNFTDARGNRMETTYIDFEVVEKSEAFDVQPVKKGSDEYITLNRVGRNTELVLTFNKPVNKEAAENKSNYFFGKDGKKLPVDDAIVERDGQTVTLVFYDTTPAELADKYVMMELSPAIRSKDNEAIEDSRFFDLRTGKRLEETPAPQLDGEVVFKLNDNEVKERVQTVDKDGEENKITVEYKGESNNVQALMYRANGQLTSAGVKDLSPNGKVEFTINTGDTDYKNAPFKIEIKDGNKVIDTLEVKIVDTTAKGKVTFKLDETKIIDLNENTKKSYFLGEDVELEKLTKDDFKVEATEPATLEDVEYTVDTLFIKIRSEKGVPTTYKIEFTNEEVTNVEAEK